MKEGVGEKGGGGCARFVCEMVEVMYEALFMKRLRSQKSFGTNFVRYGKCVFLLLSPSASPKVPLLLGSISGTRLPPRPPALSKLRTPSLSLCFFSSFLLHLGQ